MYTKLKYVNNIMSINPKYVLKVWYTLYIIITHVTLVLT